MELLASKFSWTILKKLILQGLQEPLNLASDEEQGGGYTHDARGVDQQQQQGVGVEVQELDEQSNSSSSGNMAAQYLADEKVRAANVKQKEELLKQLKKWFHTTLPYI